MNDARSSPTLEWMSRIAAKLLEQRELVINPLDANRPKDAHLNKIVHSFSRNNHIAFGVP